MPARSVVPPVDLATRRASSRVWWLPSFFRKCSSLCVLTWRTSPFGRAGSPYSRPHRRPGFGPRPQFAPGPFRAQSPLCRGTRGVPGPDLALLLSPAWRGRRGIQFSVRRASCAPCPNARLLPPRIPPRSQRTRGHFLHRRQLRGGALCESPFP
jgi:hypothetical protein